MGKSVQLEDGDITVGLWSDVSSDARPKRHLSLVPAVASPNRMTPMLPTPPNSLRVTPRPALLPSTRSAHTPHLLWVNGNGKRALDISVALVALLLVAPLLTLLAILVKLSSRGPVLFRQQRMGMAGRAFTILKFRTMRVQDGPSVTARNDARITTVGRLLRRSKLDELPQIVNVLRGDMSLVGPRPKISGHQFSDLICRPGMTGAATLAFIEEEKMLVTVPEEHLETYVVDVLHQIKAEVDHEYALRSTFTTDLKLLFSTALHLFRIRRSGQVDAMNDHIRSSHPN